MDRLERFVVCKRCGSVRACNANFCTKCGAATESSSNVESSSDNVRASREAILLAAARCTSTKRPFAIRFEQGVSGIWHACGAFAISESQLSNSAFSSDGATSLGLSSSYPGCPHCGADSRKEFAGVSFVRCSCGKLACSTGIIGAMTLCPWCDRVGTLARHGPLHVLGMKDR